MKTTPSIYRHLPRHDTRQGSAVTIGNFDGVHIGHRAILSCLRDAAAEQNLLPTVMTFVPHPRTFFAHKARRPELIPTQISSLRDKVTLLAGEGVAQIILARFNQGFADMQPDTFISRLLVEGLNTRWLLVGEDFRFGTKRAGDIHLLRQAGQQFGFVVQTIDDVTDSQDRRVSSTDVRTALAVGDLDKARALLGAPYRISGHVIHGRKLGRTIGYPTLNLRVPVPCAARSGIYVVRVHGLTDQPIPGVASLGVRPTVADRGTLLLETHLLDHTLDAYGKLASVEFLKYLRDEEKFPDLPTLTAAIANDVRGARDYFAIHGL